ncbi:MAG: roadblock/LC7 domain-containing protein, partial [Pyrinomonadaceae bacterium]
IIGRVLLIVVFDERTSLGLVKLRVKQVSTELANIFEEIKRDSSNAANDTLQFAEISEDEIDSLFN